MIGDNAAKVEDMNLLQKLSKVRGMAEVVSKSRQGFKYSYADITDILAKITAGMKKYHVSLIPSVEPKTATVTPNTITNTKMTKEGKPVSNVTTEMLVSADMIFTWIDDDHPESKIDVPWVVIGSQGDPSQAFGSGLTYCTRYFLCNYFQIAQPDTDVDAYRTKQKQAEAEEAREILKSIVEEIDKSVKHFLSENPDKKDEAKRFMSKFVKDANYKTIKDVEIAGNLLTAFNEKFN